MEKRLAAAIKAAKLAGDLQLERLHSNFYINKKGPANLVTEIDLKSEQVILNHLWSTFPDIPAVTEETESSFELSGKEHWIIDPLDGTTNYAHGYPMFSVSIALEKNGQVELGVVYLPVLDQLFTAVRGKGALLNGKAIHVSGVNSLNSALAASGFPYDSWTNSDNNTSEWSRMIRNVTSMRCDGCASCNLCYVAAGYLDGYWELDLEAWDMAAGALIVKEAGGMVTLTNGEPFSPYQRSIFASNTLLHSDILSVLNIVE